jgi:hypothetical protein
VRVAAELSEEPKQFRVAFALESANLILNTLERGCGRLAKAIPKPSILDDYEYFGYVAGDRRWRDAENKHLYTWDSLHGEVEVFTRRGKHLGALDPVTGKYVKDAVRGRTIGV